MATFTEASSRIIFLAERQQLQTCFHRPWVATAGHRLCHRLHRRSLQTSSKPPLPDFGFAFDIDGVLVRGKKALPQAAYTLKTLREQRIPYLLLSNGGGYHEEKRAENLSKEIGVRIDHEQVLQSHTPFQDMHEYKDGTTLIVGAEFNNARDVARKYGFKNAVTPSDIYKQDPSIWPFSRPLMPYHNGQAPPLPIPQIDPSNLSQSLKIDSIFVYNDPRDWGLDLAVIIDLLLSHRGYIGTLSGKNGLAELSNNGYQRDGQPPLFFSNPDMWFAADFNLPRLGQGAFRAAVEGVWRDVTGGATLQRRVFGKPNQETYEYAEKQLQRIADDRDPNPTPLRNVYMIGDNPESDIRGATMFKSPTNVNWHGLLVETGIYTGGEPSVKPTAIVAEVWKAVEWGMAHSKKQ